MKSKAYTTEEFVKRARATHGRRYSYAKTVYVNAKTKVTVTCKKHGDFQQIPWWHMDSQGCPKCGGTAKRCTKDFVASAKQVHGDEYGYQKVKYTLNKEPVTIVCRTHGDFKQSPDNHLAGKGCLHCGQAKVRTHRYKIVSIGGKKFKVQGYEPFALIYMTTVLRVAAKNIMAGKRIPYVQYTFKNRERTHYPDFWIESENRLVEVKSPWTLGIVGAKKHKDYFEELKAKRAGAIAAGFTYSLLVFNGSGERMPMPKNWHTLTKAELVKYVESKLYCTR